MRSRSDLTERRQRLRPRGLTGPNLAGWNNTPVTVEFDVHRRALRRGGRLRCSRPPRPRGPIRRSRADAVDLAGNSATLTVRGDQYRSHRSPLVGSDGSIGSTDHGRRRDRHLSAPGRRGNRERRELAELCARFGIAVPRRRHDVWSAPRATARVMPARSAVQCHGHCPVCLPRGARCRAQGSLCRDRTHHHFEFPVAQGGRFRYWTVPYWTDSASRCRSGDAGQADVSTTMTTATAGRISHESPAHFEATAIYHVVFSDEPRPRSDTDCTSRLHLSRSAACGTVERSSAVTRSRRPPSTRGHHTRRR